MGPQVDPTEGSLAVVYPICARGSRILHWLSILVMLVPPSSGDGCALYSVLILGWVRLVLLG